MKNLNVKSLICNCAILVSSILVLVFLSQAHIASEFGFSSGYDYLGFPVSEGKSVALGVGLLIATIFACVLILTSIYGLLRLFNVVKENPCDKYVRLANIVCAALAVVGALLAMIMAICLVGEANQQAGIAIISVGWAVVVNFCLAVISVVAAVFDRK